MGVIICRVIEFLFVRYELLFRDNNQNFDFCSASRNKPFVLNLHFRKFFYLLLRVRYPSDFQQFLKCGRRFPHEDLLTIKRS
jgi:hypothetical protein